MDYFSAIILGLVQGLTEFLPVSSSGHLVLSQSLLGLPGPQMAFDLLLHLGTLLAVIIYFRAELIGMARSVFIRSDAGGSRRWLIMIIVATIPTALIGFAFQESFEQQFGDAHFAAVCLLITGALLFISDRVRVAAKSGERIGAVQALIVGIAQGIAIIPGISRSGATIAAGIFSGIERSTAARFSFLLSIPAILGACILEASSFLAIRATDLLPYALGVIVAFISGFLSIDILLRVTAKRHLWHFSVYLLVVGLLGFILT